METDKQGGDELISRLANLLNKGDPESGELLSVLNQIRIKGISKQQNEPTPTPTPSSPHKGYVNGQSEVKESTLSKLESSYDGSVENDRVDGLIVQSIIREDPNESNIHIPVRHADEHKESDIKYDVPKEDCVSIIKIHPNKQDDSIEKNGFQIGYEPQELPPNGININKELLNNSIPTKKSLKKNLKKGSPIMDKSIQINNVKNISRRSASPIVKYNFEDFLERQRMHEYNVKQKMEYLANIVKDNAPKAKVKNLFESIKPKKAKIKPRIRKNERKITKKEETVVKDVLYKSKEYERVKSKLQLQKDLDTLMQRIQYRKEEKEKRCSQEKYIKSLEEIITCTHKPRLSPLPKYLRSSRNKSPQVKFNTNKCSKKNLS